jgi:hypothetical protein
MESLTIQNIMAMLANIATFLGIPIALVVFFREKKRERLDREYGTYDALDQKYIEYLELCLKHPDLDVFDIELKSKKLLTPKQQRRELILLTILISNLERSFLMYQDQSSKLKRKQWSGWSTYIREWCRRENFRAAWQVVGDQFDSDFTRFIESTIKQTNKVPKNTGYS